MTRSSEPDEFLAQELAFGLLDPDAAAAGERRVAEDGAFGPAVALWRRRAAALISLPAVSPRPSLWPEIRRRTFGAPPVTTPRRALRVWQGVSAITTALLAASVVLLVSRAPMPAPPPASASGAPRADLALLTGSGAGAMAVRYDGAARSLAVLASGVRPGRRDVQLWLLPSTGNPISLGVVVLRDDRAVVPLAGRGRSLGIGSALAVSLEPVGGSPTGLPTGPVILTGKIEGIGGRVVS